MMNRIGSRWTSLLVTACALLGLVSAATPLERIQKESTIVNTAISGVIDLRSPITTQETSVTFKVDESSPKPASYYYFAIPNNVATSQLSYVKASEKKTSLEVSLDSRDADYHYYKVTLAEPLKAGSKARILLSLVFIEAIKPYPREIPQVGTQQYAYSGNAFLLSPYTTETAKTTVKIPSGKAPNYKNTDIPVSYKDEKIQYGPVKDLKPLQDASIYVQYYDKQANLVVTDYQKSFEISHWANTIVVKEDFELHHNGAAIDGFFSRIDYKLSFYEHSRTNVVKGFNAYLPAKATNVFYKDVVGNVSTSHFRQEHSRSVLELEPRYPLYGGWKYTWFHGYTVPASDLVKHEKGSNTYVLSVQLIGSIRDLATRAATLRIVLPEGAKFLRVDAPFHLDSTSDSISYSYFDTTGRPTVILRKSKIVDLYDGDIKIYYEFDNIRLLQKPLAVAAYIFGFFIIVMVYTRLDLSITVDPAKEIRNKLALYRHQISKLASKEGRSLIRLTSAFDNFKSDRDLKAFESTKATLTAEFASIDSELDKIAKAAASIDKSYAGKVSKLSEALSARLKRVHDMHQKVVNFLVVEGKQNGKPVDEKKKLELTQEVEKFDQEYEALSADVKQILKQVSE